MMNGMTQGAALAYESLLLVEDDQALADMLRRHLGRAGFLVHAAATERDAIRRAQEVAPDAVILDLALAQGDGSSVCTWLRGRRETADTPVLVLSARDDVRTKVDLLTGGADDYVTKPCDPQELIARVRGLIRRREGPRALRRIGDLQVAVATGDAWVGDRVLDLTAGERRVLSILVRDHPSLTRRASLEGAHDGPSPASNVAEVLIARLRRKLAGAGSRVRIRPVRGAGYVLRVDESGIQE